jgi:hypothetical protein
LGILGGSVHTVKKNAEALVVASKENGLEVDADKTKYIAMSRDQNAGRSHKRNIDSKSLGRVERFRYLGTALTNQNYIQEETNRRLKSRNACYHLVQNGLSSCLLWSTYGERRGACRVLVKKPGGKGTLRRLRRRWEDNIKVVLQEVGRGHGLE